ncbi:LGFP repeat-containing protein [Peribacillus simplex]|uniref:LGFP repeat-containing protein n=1 Tax=Peribacillus simplex TaxID=1478 RepID=UPI003D264FCD
MYYHPSSTSNPWQFYNLYSYPRIISVNPYFYPYSSFFPRSFEEMWQSYNSSPAEYYSYSIPRERNQLGYPNVPQRDRPLLLPPPPPNLMEAVRREKARKTIEYKWKKLYGAPGKSISSSAFAVGAVEKVGDGYRIRYENGAIYTQNSGSAYWVHGLIGQKYDALGGVQSWLGFPISDEIPLQDGGRVSRFEKGEIYWWDGMDPIDLNEVTLTYTGTHCFGTTDGPGTDEVYAIISVIPPSGNTSTAMTKLYNDVDDGESLPDYIELYRGKPYGLNLNFVLFERDQGDPNVYKKTVESSVQAAAGLITTAIGVVASPAAAAVAGPILVSLAPTVSKEINNLLGTADDFLGESTLPLSMKDMVQLATRPDELVHNNQIRKKLETHLLTGDGSSYKGYFNLHPAPTLPTF